MIDNENFKCKYLRASLVWASRNCKAIFKKTENLKMCYKSLAQNILKYKWIDDLS